MADERYILIRPPQLPELESVQAGAYVVGYDTATDRTVKINVSALGGGTEVDINWKNTTTYNTGEVVEYGLKLWKSVIDDNLGNFPAEGTLWTEVSKAGAGSNITNYTTGVYTFEPSLVIKDGKLYRLNAAIPFESVDFEAERATFKWQLVNDNNLIGVAYGAGMTGAYKFVNQDDTLIVLSAGSIDSVLAGTPDLTITLTEPSYIIKTGLGNEIIDFTILPIYKEGQNNLVYILDADTAGNDPELEVPLNGVVLALHTSGSFQWVNSSGTLLQNVEFTEPSIISRIGAGTTLADLSIKPLKDLIYNLPQTSVAGLVAKLIELEQSNPVRYVRFLRSTTSILFTNTYYDTTTEEGSGSPFLIPQAITGTTELGADFIAQFAGIPTPAGAQFEIKQINIDVQAQKNATSRQVFLYAEFWNMDAAGTLTQLGVSNVLELSETAESKPLFVSLPVNYTTTEGDRAVLIFKGYQTGTGVNATATLLVNGTTGSRWSFDTVVSGGATLIDNTGVVYVSKVGLDSNSGLNINSPKLTISSALIAASALITAGATGVKVMVADGGEYTESVSVPANVYLYAAAATLKGELLIDAQAEAYFDKIIATANNQNLISLSIAGDGSAIVKANFVDGRGFTGVKLARNIGGGGKILFLELGIIYVGVDGVGIGDISGGIGHIHFNIKDFYLAGNNAIGVLGSVQGANFSDSLGYIDHFIQIGGTTGTTAIKMDNANAQLQIFAGEIIADTVYNVIAGQLHLVCPKVVGTRTGAALFDLANVGAHIDGVDEEKHGTEQINNAAALPNIESDAAEKQSVINGNINARLFEQIAFVLSGYGIDITTDSQDILKSIPYAFKAYELRAEVATAPTGGNAIITFYKNGVSIGTVTILAGAFVGVNTLVTAVSFAKGDSLSAAVTQIGLTIPGATAKAYVQGIKYQ